MKDIKFYPKICWGVAISVIVLGLGTFIYSQSNNDIIEGGCFEGPGASPPKSMKKNCCTQTDNKNKPTSDCECDPCECDPCECGPTSDCKCDPCECDPCECGPTSDCEC